jgi:hypothetical protein
VRITKALAVAGLAALAGCSLGHARESGISRTFRTAKSADDAAACVGTKLLAKNFIVNTVRTTTGHSIVHQLSSNVLGVVDIHAEPSGGARMVLSTPFLASVRDYEPLVAACI